MARCFVSIGAAACVAGSAMATVTLWNNGPLVTNPGAGAGGADVSQVWAGQGLFGASFSQPAYSRAENFTVSGGGWNISSMTFFGYQTGSGNSSTITGLYAQIWNGDPRSGGTVVWGNMTTSIMSSTAWTGIYRTDATLSTTNRPIMDIVANGLNVSLADGQYWIEFAATGSSPSGPWVPLVSSPSAAVIGDSLLYTVSSTSWSEQIANTNGQGFELPFILSGTAAVPGSGVIALGLVGLAGSRRRR